MLVQTVINYPCYFRSTREEAKITAWENLQKAKAEAAIRKLEVHSACKRDSYEFK